VAWARKEQKLQYITEMHTNENIIYTVLLEVRTITRIMKIKFMKTAAISRYGSNRRSASLMDTA